MLFKSKISKGFQIVVPSKIRKKFGIEEGDLVEWIDTKEGASVKFRKQKKLKDIVGIVSTPSDAVELKKEIQRGE
jgi:AbrB family looped-hinge helix DNA binding protein